MKEEYLDDDDDDDDEDDQHQQQQTNSTTDWLKQAGEGVMMGADALEIISEVGAELGAEGALGSFLSVVTESLGALLAMLCVL